MRFWLFLIPLFLNTGCGTYYGAIPTNHIVMVNTEGHPVDPTGNTSCERAGDFLCNGAHNTLVEYPTLTDSDYRKSINDLLTNLQQGKVCGAASEISYFKEMEAKGTPPKLLIFIHGGLNTQTGSVQRAAELCQSIASGGYYPLFLNWQSALSLSYWNHLVRIRQGEDWGKGTLSRIGGYLTSPGLLFGDFTRSILRVPVATFFQIRNDVETVPLFRSALSLWWSDLALAQEITYTALCQRAPNFQILPPSAALKEYAAILHKAEDQCATHGIEETHELANLRLSLGTDQRGSSEKNWAFTKYLLTLPTKFLSAPIIDAGGTSAWAMMLRSVSQLFHYDGEPHTHNNLNHTHPNGKSYESRGSLYLFFEELQTAVCKSQDKVRACPNPGKWEITLVGHSTGAIIIHHILREFEELPITNIVYMGAASSIRDYQETVFPYLIKRNKNRSGKQCWPLGPVERSQEATCVYHLILHEAAESGEWLWESIDPFPRGSLLIWLDNFLSHPLSKEDRTLGRFTNFITSVHHTPSELRPFIHIHKFGVGEAVDEPKKHGDFSQKLKFWNSKCWEAWPTDNDCYSVEGHY